MTEKINEDSPVDSTDKKIEKPEDNVNHINKYVSIAEEILKDNPLEFFVKTMSNFHFGDDWIKRLLILASFSPYVQQQDEFIHVTITGTSGKGKSSVAQAFLECLPPEVYEYWSGCSEKYPLYRCKENPNALKNKVLYIDDDVMIDPSFVRSIKTPSRSGIVRYGTVMEQKALELNMEGTPVVIESKVHKHLDPQDNTRSLVVTVNDSDEHLKQVREFIIYRECSGKKSINNARDTLIPQTIYRLLIKTGWKGVLISKELGEKIPEGIDARKLKRFFGILKCSAYLNQHKREHKDGCIVATEEDLNVVLQIYSQFLGSEILGVDSLDLQILRFLNEKRTADYDFIGEAIEKSRETAFNHVKKLAENGLVTTKRDGRKDWVLLTYKGEEVLKRIDGIDQLNGTNEKKTMILDDDKLYHA